MGEGLSSYSCLAPNSSYNLLCLIVVACLRSLVTRPETCHSIDPMRPSMRSWFSSGLLVLPGVLISLTVAARPVHAQCMLNGWMGGGYCYDWGNMFSGSTVRIFSSGGKFVQAQTPFGVMNGEWVAPGCSAGCRRSTDLLLRSKKYRTSVRDL
jgi:hypothetical protein